MSSRNKLLHLPDTLTCWPWPRTINQHYEAVRAESDAFSAQSQYAFDKCDFGAKHSGPLPVESDFALIMDIHGHGNLFGLQDFSPLSQVADEVAILHSRVTLFDVAYSCNHFCVSFTAQRIAVDLGAAKGHINTTLSVNQIVASFG
ncbi:hypothetical protein ACEPAF_73 [Sanghuangporus sanghuang]